MVAVRAAKHDERGCHVAQGRRRQAGQPVGVQMLAGLVRVSVRVRVRDGLRLRLRLRLRSPNKACAAGARDVSTPRLAISLGP